ncbi:hypothetical protein BaRGS_00013727 [Batillaria attramentaria]|uniref:CARD domain-containing protein n=1 Tax=Batillaria attramentaria TaxID=370345 RepID=A0ABD0L7D9_9CAEN
MQESGDWAASEAETGPAIYRDQEEFLRAIHTNFLKSVQPLQSGLIDELRSRGAITVDDEEKVKAGEIPKERARRMWDILREVPSKTFGEMCMPVLKELYGYVLEGAEYQSGSQSEGGSKCLRHVITTRFRVKSFADEIFPHIESPGDQECRKISESKESGVHLWDRIFALLKENCVNRALKEKVAQFLRNNDIHLTNFTRNFRSGFPCRCRAVLSPVKSSSDKFLSINNESSDDYPSSHSSEGRVSDTGSVSSSDGEEGHNTGKQVKDRRDQFNTQEDRDKYQTTLSKINEVLIDAARLKTYLRELESIRDAEKLTESASSCVPVPDSVSETSSVTLTRKVDDIRIQKDSFLESATRTLSESSELETWAQSGFPPARVKYILGRRQQLAHDVDDVRRLFEEVIQTFFDPEPQRVHFELDF